MADYFTKKEKIEIKKSMSKDYATGFTDGKKEGIAEFKTKLLAYDSIDKKKVKAVADMIGDYL